MAISPEVPPGEQELPDGDMYRCQCSFDGDGRISTPDESIVCELTTLHRRRPFFVTYGLFRDPGFSITEINTGIVYRVARERLLPLTRFVMSREGERVCTISQRSPLLNLYTISFVQGATWRFQMPLFSVIFRGICDNSGIIYVRERAKRDWYLLVQEHPDHILLLYAIAFIQRERLRAT